MKKIIGSVVKFCVAYTVVSITMNEVKRRKEKDKDNIILVKKDY